METKVKIAYYPGAKPTARITPVKVKASRQGVAEIQDMQGAWVASVGDLSTARYIARCINANEKLIASLRRLVDDTPDERNRARSLLCELGEAL